MESPSQEVVKSQTEIVTDARGREIIVRKLKPIDRLRLVELIGGENAVNEPYLGYATMAYSVSKIDGSDVAIPRTKTALEALVQRLDDDGLTAAGEAMKKLYSSQIALGIEEIKNA